MTALFPAALVAQDDVPAGAGPAGPVPNVVAGATQAPGAAAARVMAADLYVLGVARKDALTVAMAARLAMSVDLRDTPRDRTTGGDAAGDDISEGAESPPDAAAMLAAARSLAGDDDLLIALLDRAEREQAFTSGASVAATPSRLLPGQTDHWRIALYGGVYSELAVLGDGDTALSVRVTDADGQAVCDAQPATDRVICGLIPDENGYFTVSVQNPGGMVNSYLLLTD